MHYQPKQDLLNDRIILVTGASDGIGREAAMTYARYGATVILLGRNEEKLRQVASHINEEIGRQPQWFILGFANLHVRRLPTNWHSALPLIIRVWMVFCIMPDCSAMFAQ